MIEADKGKSGMFFKSNTLIKFISYRKENVCNNYITNLEAAQQNVFSCINVWQNFWKKQRKKSVHEKSLPWPYKHTTCAPWME